MMNCPLLDKPNSQTLACMPSLSINFLLLAACLKDSPTLDILPMRQADWALAANKLTFLLNWLRFIAFSVSVPRTSKDIQQGVQVLATLLRPHH